MNGKFKVDEVKCNKNGNLVYAFAMAVILLLLISRIYNMYYAVNDDITFRDLFSGMYTGAPSYSLVIQWPLSSIFQLIFKGFQGIDFWAYYLILSHLVCWIVWIERVFTCVDKKLYAIILVVILLLVLDIPNVIFFQFTTTATVYAATGLVLLSDRRKGRSPWAILMFVLAFATRRENFIMATPFIVLVLGVKIYEERENIVSVIKAEMKFVIVLAILIGTICRVDSYLYEGTDNVEYRNIKTIIYDYQGVPDWDSNLEFYDNLGISWGEYEAIRTHNTGFDFSKDITEILTSISNYNKELTGNLGIKTQIKNAINIVWLMSQRIMVLPQIFALVFCMIVVSITAIYYKKIIYLLMAAVGFGGAWGEVFLLAYRGRLPERVYQSIILVALVWLLIMFFKIEEKVNRNWQYILLVIGMSIILCCALRPAVREKQNEYAQRFKMAETVREYGRSNPDNVYFTPYNFNSGNTDIFGHSYNNTFNNIFRLGLGIESEQYEEKLAYAGITQSVEQAILTQSNVYIMGLNEEKQLNIFHEYFEDKYGERYYYETIDVLDEAVQVIKLGLVE